MEPPLSASRICTFPLLNAIRLPVRTSYLNLLSGERGIAPPDGAKYMADALASASRDGDAEALAAAVRAALADDGLGQEDIFQVEKHFL